MRPPKTRRRPSRSLCNWTQLCSLPFPVTARSIRTLKPSGPMWNIHCRSGTFPPRPAEAPDASQATPLPPPGRSKPLLRSLPPRKSHAQRAVIPPRHKGRPVSQQRLKSLRPLPVGGPAPRAHLGRTGEGQPAPVFPSGVSSSRLSSPAEPVWVNSASRRQAKAPEKASAEPPRRQPPRDSAPKPASSPPKAPAPKPPPPPEAQFRDASQRQRGRPVRLGFCLFFCSGRPGLGLFAAPRDTWTF